MVVRRGARERSDACETLLEDARVRVAAYRAPLLRPLPPAALRAVVSLSRLRHFHARDLVALEGQHHDRIYLVLDGSIVETRTTLDGRGLVQAVRRRFDVLNGQVAFGSHRTSASIHTVHASCLLQILGPDLRGLLTEHPTLLAALAGVLADDFRRVSDERAWLTSDTAAARILRRMLELADAFGEELTEGGVLITLRLSQEELGSWAGASRESVAKLLQELRRDGLISTGRRHLIIRDPSELRRRLMAMLEFGVPERLVTV